MVNPNNTLAVATLVATLRSRLANAAGTTMLTFQRQEIATALTALEGLLKPSAGDTDADVAEEVLLKVAAALELPVGADLAEHAESIKALCTERAQALADVTAENDSKDTALADLILQVDTLKTAAREIYLAGRWLRLDGNVDEAADDALWLRFRDTFGIEPGTATAAA